jgi:anti-sigma factor RsiW
MPNLSCEAVHSLIPELALGLLDGRESAQVLAHLEHCPACQHELLLMGDVADRLVELTPPAEPPAGFESRVMTALETLRPSFSSPPPAHLRPAGRERPRRSVGSGRAKDGRWPRRVATGLVAAVVTASVGVGGWALGHHEARPAPAASSAGNQAVVAELVGHKQHVGEVIVTGNGRYQVMWTVSSSPLGNGWVTCEFGEQDGTWLRMASFQLANGRGYWSTPMPNPASPITLARVVDESGHTVGTASIPT